MIIFKVWKNQNKFCYLFLLKQNNCLILEETSTIIQCSFVKEKEQTEKDGNSEKNIEPVDKDGNYVINYIKSFFTLGQANDNIDQNSQIFSVQNQNKILKSLRIGNSFLTLEVGCIIKTKACLIND